MSDSPGITNWITEAIALIALVKPEISKLIHKMWRPKKFEINEKGKIRIGFYWMGPIVEFTFTKSHVSPFVHSPRGAERLAFRNPVS